MIQYIVTVVMGTVIGYGTNCLAVKMMFRPKHEVKLFGKTLPFTPGVIPKQKEKLAAAIGNAVGTSLLTKDDIKSRLMKEELKLSVTEKINEVLSAKLKDEIMHLSKQDDAGYDKMKSSLSGLITAQILKSVNSVGIGDRISDETSKVLIEKTSGSMLKFVLNDEMIKSFTDHLGKKVQEYIDEKGEDIVSAEVNNRLNRLEEESVTELLEKVDITEEKLAARISEYYDKAVDRAVEELMSRIDISKMIKDKIDEMDIDTLEELVMKVMKEQLDVIVNLGALIGFLLSLVNVGINALAK